MRVAAELAFPESATDDCYITAVRPVFGNGKPTAQDKLWTKDSKEALGDVLSMHLLGHAPGEVHASAAIIGRNISKYAGLLLPYVKLGRRAAWPFAAGAGAQQLNHAIRLGVVERFQQHRVHH